MTVADKLREEGLERGKKEAFKLAAKAMIVDGEPIAKIMKYTRLTKEEIEEIKKEMVN